MKQSRITGDVPEAVRILHAIEAHDSTDPAMTEARKQIVFRIATGLLASVDGLATMAGQSRNEMLMDLVKAGVQAVCDEMTQPMLEAFTDAQNEALNALGD